MEWFVDVAGEQQKAGSTDEHNRIDFRERRAFVQVTNGQLVARFTPPRVGQAGADVYGGEIKPNKPAENKPQPGKNIAVSPDGMEFKSTMDGHLFVAGRKLSVDQLCEIRGDVDFKTGNVRYPGNVQITGSIIPGFRVEASGNVIVSGLVDNGEIRAEGDVVVQGGIVGHSRVLARGNISAKFVQESLLQADGDITIADAIVQSIVSSCRNFTITSRSGSKGILGGKLYALNDVTTCCIGSDLAIPTLITIGVSAKHLFDEHQLQSGLAEQKKENARVQKLLDSTKSPGLPPIRGAPAQASVARAPSVVVEKPATKPSSLGDAKLTAPPPLGAVRVYGTAFEGTTLFFVKRQHKLQEQHTFVVFRLNPADDTVVTDTLIP